MFSHKPLHLMLDPHFRCFPHFRSCWKHVLGEIGAFAAFSTNFVISLIALINKMENEKTKDLPPSKNALIKHCNSLKVMFPTNEIIKPISCITINVVGRSKYRFLNMNFY